VVYPPVDVEQFHRSDAVSDEFIWVGQLVPYKRPDIAVDAFTRSGRKLHVIGDGSMLADLKKRAGPNIRFTTRMKFDQLREAYATARALVFTAEEDFGIIPVESQAAGRPVLVYGRGGGTETVVDGVTGLYIAEQTAEAVMETLDRFDIWLPGFDPAAAILQAQNFTRARFVEGFLAAVKVATRRVFGDGAEGNAAD
jgi:glycosyltransferase involved in cell wall biosynthesis